MTIRQAVDAACDLDTPVSVSVPDVQAALREAEAEAQLDAFDFVVLDLLDGVWSAKGIDPDTQKTWWEIHIKKET